MNAPSNAIHPALTEGETARVVPRIVLLNVKYSPNLGDGLLAECLERELANSLPSCEVVSIDLAGRQRYRLAKGRMRGVTIALLDRCPKLLRQFAVWIMLRLLLALRLSAHYRAGLHGAHAVVVGGGNLFTDADLNFPMKISGALAQAARRKLPVAIYAVGVSPTWSPAGHKLFTAAIRKTRLVSASARDRRSQEAWQSHFADHPIRPAQVAIDPGMLASLHYPRSLSQRTGRKVGMCITDPLAVRYHSSSSAAATLEPWYPAALRSLVEHGFEVALFTNGSPEDREYLNSRFHDWIRHAKGPVTISRSFETPQDLAALVSGCDAIVAHRMHACIAAFSFGVPAIGLRWDVKLESFFQLAGRAGHVLDPAETGGGELGKRMAAAIADPPDPAPFIARARTEIAAFAQLMRDSARASA